MPIVARGSVLTAADAASGDYFGSGVAISADGLVMAVAAMYWEGANSNQGGVYIFDWSGSAWTQRGSVLVASDAAANDYFGTSVALNAAGTVLAVGAIEWEGSKANQGGVYIFDWSGSAWTQRGSVLQYASAAIADNFGSAVALNAVGDVLAVGAWGIGNFGGRAMVYDWSGSAWTQRGVTLPNAPVLATDYRYGSSIALDAAGDMLAVGCRGWGPSLGGQGAVFIYDWSGSAWGQRGSVLTLASATGGDYFGAGLALSADGAVLAVGAMWQATQTANGRVFIHDWTGSVWLLRTTVDAADGAATDGFGMAVALAAAADVLVVGAPKWEGASTDQGGVYVYDVSVDNLVVAPTELTVLAVQGTIEAPTALTVEQRVRAPTALTIVNPSGTIAAPTALAITASGTIAAPTALAVASLAGGLLDAPRWSARCLIDGVDVSDSLTGAVRVVAAEGAARLADCTIRPPAGAFAPLDYVGKPITLDYVPLLGGVPVPLRLFTGRIDTPAYDFDACLLSLACVDDLQNRVAALPRGTVSMLIGGRFSTAVQGEIDDNWDYAQARLTTVAGSLDAGPSGGLRVTPWASSPVWATLGAGQLIYPRTQVSYPQRSTIVNEVEIEFDYRYPRLRQRYTTLGWSGTLADMAACGYQYPTQQDILGAAGGSGWTVTLGIFWPAPAAIPHSSGGFVYPADGSIDMAVLHLGQRHSQTVTESYRLTVRAPESVAANGRLPATLRGALESSFDGGAWESALDVAPLLPAGGEMDYAPDAPRGDADYAIQTLLDQARVKILGSHRSTRVTNATVCNPDLDLDKRVAIATDGLDAEGKIVEVEHLLDLNAGSAVSTFTLACFGAGGAGIVSPDTLAPPAAPDPVVETQNWAGEIPPLFVNTFGHTPYSDGLMGLVINPTESVYVEDIPPGGGAASFPNPGYVSGTYPVQGFRVRMPGVADADRNPAARTVQSAYVVRIDPDPLQITQP